MLKTIALIVVVLIAGILIYAATKPDSFRIQRSLRIQAPPEKIYPMIEDLKLWTTWSPYEKKDPQMQRSFGAVTRGKGARYAWEGNKDVGAGSMEIVEASPPSKIAVALNFLKPFEAHNMAEFTLEPVASPQGAQATTVTWALHGPMPYISKLMSTFFDMDAMVGKDFEAGLAELKQAAEK